jgi:cytosine deaminase
MSRLVEVTELVLRDGHQSLLATRMALEDMIPVCDDIDQAGFWSVECWGGATYDACIRFLNEDPWERLRIFRKLLPNSRLQMLLRGQNLLGYRHYEDTVVDRFVDKSAENGMDVFRVFDALNDVRERVRPYLDLQLVAFPQDGFLRADGARANLERALGKGVDVVGGIPHFERTMAEGAESVRILCEIAAERGLRVDMHCDETDDPHSRHIETLAHHTRRLGLSGRVTGSHLTSMHSMDNYYASKLIPLIAEAGVSAVANPLINITIQGRHDTYPKRRGMTRVPELMAAGVDVAFGHDCVLDPWYPLGSGDMLEVAHMGLHVAQMTGQAAMRACFDALTTTPARILGLEGYGLAPGCHADFVLLEARDVVEAIRLRATRLAVVRRGRVIARTPSAATALDLPGRPSGTRYRIGG